MIPLGDASRRPFRFPIVITFIIAANTLAFPMMAGVLLRTSALAKELGIGSPEKRKHDPGAFRK